MPKKSMKFKVILRSVLAAKFKVIYLSVYIHIILGLQPEGADDEFYDPIY